LKRIAQNLGIGYSGSKNLGSTWYSTPEKLRIVAYLTLINMAYLSQEEFSEPEKNGNVGTALWPYW
jgi:hypothetical protein